MRLDYVTARIHSQEKDKGRSGALDTMRNEI